MHTNVTVAITSLSDRTVRHHPLLPRQYISRDRYGQRVGHIRNLLAKGISEVRPRVGPAATRLVAEVQAAPNRAEAEKIISGFDSTRMSHDEYGRLQALLTDILKASKFP